VVCNGVHFLEFGQVNVTESSSFAFRFGDFSARCAYTSKKLLSLIIFAILLLLLCKHLRFDSSSFVPHVLHQFLGFITKV
jgi:hypothetical protein